MCRWVSCREDKAIIGNAALTCYDNEKSDCVAHCEIGFTGDAQK